MPSPRFVLRQGRGIGCRGHGNGIACGPEALALASANEDGDYTVPQGMPKTDVGFLMHRRTAFHITHDNKEYTIIPIV